MKEILIQNGAITTTTPTTSSSLLVGSGVLDPSALVEINSTSKGFLMPSMSSAQREAISSPASGLAVYDSDQQGYYGFAGTPAFAVGNDLFGYINWQAVASGASGNAISVQYLNNGTFPETVTVTGNAIVVNMNTGNMPGFSTNDTIYAALTASAPATALLSFTNNIPGDGAYEIDFGPVFLTGGAPSWGEFFLGNINQLFSSDGFYNIGSPDGGATFFRPNTMWITDTIFINGDNTDGLGQGLQIQNNLGANIDGDVQMAGNFNIESRPASFRTGDLTFGNSFPGGIGGQIGIGYFDPKYLYLTGPVDARQTGFDTGSNPLWPSGQEVPPVYATGGDSFYSGNPAFPGDPALTWQAVNPGGIYNFSVSVEFLNDGTFPETITTSTAPPRLSNPPAGTPNQTNIVVHMKTGTSTSSSIYSAMTASSAVTSVLNVTLVTPGVLEPDFGAPTGAYIRGGRPDYYRNRLYFRTDNNLYSIDSFVNEKQYVSSTQPLWTTYTPTVTNTPTFSAASYYYYIAGKVMYITGKVTVSSAGVAGSVVRVSLPAGTLAANTVAGQTVGSLKYFRTGVGIYVGSVEYYDVDGIAFATTYSLANDLLDTDFLSGDSLSWTAQIPLA